MNKLEKVLLVIVSVMFIYLAYSFVSLTSAYATIYPAPANPNPPDPSYKYWMEIESRNGNYNYYDFYWSNLPMILDVSSGKTLEEIKGTSITYQVLQTGVHATSHRIDVAPTPIIAQCYRWVDNNTSNSIWTTTNLSLGTINLPSTSTNFAMIAASTYFYSVKSNYPIHNAQGIEQYAPAQYELYTYKNDAVLQDPKQNFVMANNDDQSKYPNGITWQFYWRKTTSDTWQLKQQFLDVTTWSSYPNAITEMDYYTYFNRDKVILFDGYWKLLLFGRNVNEKTNVAEFYWSIGGTGKEVQLLGFGGSLREIPTLTMSKVNYPEDVQLYINNQLVDTYKGSELKRSFLLPDKYFQVGDNSAEIRAMDGTVIKSYSMILEGDANGNLIHNPENDALLDAKLGIKLDKDGKPIAPEGSLNPIDWIKYFFLLMGYYVNWIFKQVINVLKIAYENIRGLLSIFALTFSFLPPEWIALGTMSITLGIFLLILRRS